MAETVTPARPAGPSVVTTFTVQAAWLMPDRKRCRNSGPSRSMSIAAAVVVLFGGGLERRLAVEPVPHRAVARFSRRPGAKHALR